MNDGDRRKCGLDLAVFAPYRVAVVARAMSEQLGAAYAGEDVTIPEWRVLAVIGQDETIAARDVVAQTPMDKMAVSRAVASLEGKDLIIREPSADKRVLTLRLSSKGKIVCERISALALAYETSIFGELSEEERKAFFAGLSKLESAVRSVGEQFGATRAAE